MSTHGRSALVTAMNTNRPSRLLKSVKNGLRVASMINASAAAPEAERTSTITVGDMSRRPTLMKRNEPPQISPRATNATYGSSRFCRSDTRRPIVGREDEGDRTVVLDGNRHVSSEAARARLYSAIAEALDENLVELLRSRGIAGAEQARAAASGHVREKRELRHDQRRSFDVGQAQVHSAGL